DKLRFRLNRPRNVCCAVNARVRSGARGPRGWRMADDSGAPPLPRRVPGATVSPGTPVRAERFVIPEDLRQRVLTAIADELQRDEAEERRRAQEQGKAENRGIPEERGTARRPVAALDEAAAQAAGETPAEAVAQGERVMAAGGAAGGEAHPGE